MNFPVLAEAKWLSFFGGACVSAGSPADAGNIALLSNDPVQSFVSQPCNATLFCKGYCHG